MKKSPKLTFLDITFEKQHIHFLMHVSLLLGRVWSTPNTRREAPKASKRIAFPINPTTMKKGESMGKGHVAWDNFVVHDELPNNYGMIRACYLVHPPKSLRCRGRHKEVTSTGGCHMILVIKTSSTNAEL